jgi:hypothetical protein
MKTELPKEGFSGRKAEMPKQRVRKLCFEIVVNFTSRQKSLI